MARGKSTKPNDKRKNNKGAPKGGYPGAGRPKKVEEEVLIAKLDAVIKQKDVMDALHNRIIDGDIKAITLYMQYRYGKPKDTVAMDITSGGKEFNLPVIEFFDTKEEE